MSQARTHRGSNLIALVEAAKQLGVLEKIIQHATPEARALLTGPLPLATTLIAGNAMDGVYEAAEAAVGRQGVRKLGFETVRGRIAVIAKPLIDSTIALYGQTPEAMLAHFGDMTGPFVQGYSFRFEREGERGGTMFINVDSPIHALAIAVWEGGIEYFMGVGGAADTANISPASISPDSMQATVRVSW